MRMKLGSVTWPSSGILIACGLVWLAANDRAFAGSKTVTFGWEDGTSTSPIDINGDSTNDLPPVYNTPDVGMGSMANVSTGSQIDYGPSGTPFPEPVTNMVTPFDGSRMLEVTLSNLTVDSGTDAYIYLGLLTGMDPGDTYRFTFYSHDPTDNRSPSAVQNSTYASVPAVTTFDGYGVRLQRFILGTGWIESELDGAAPTSGTVLPGSAIQPDVIFDPDGVLTTTQGTGSTSNMANAVRLEADLFYQSLTADNFGSEKFYIDGLTINVTSNNPNARIYLPDGTSVLVNEPPGVLGDYNNDDVVDAADYPVWRDANGTSATLPHDATPGTVDASDYDVWTAHFGQTAGSGSAQSAVPEPASIVLLVISLMGLWIGRRGRTG